MDRACWDSDYRPSSPAYPSSSSSIRLNPSAVPLDDRFGIETIGYKSEWDVGLVKGNGRIGAAISPTSGEETFFGPPAFEFPSDYLERKSEKRKFKSQKVNLATAFSIYNNKKSDLKRLQLNLGLIGKYNRLSGEVLPGAGLSAIAGPFTLGYARGVDKHVIDGEPYGVDSGIELFPYDTETYAVGLFLTSVAIDYSRQSIRFPKDPPIEVTMLTASVFFKKWIFTLASRTENSTRPDYDETKKALVTRTFKKDVFGGVQFAATKYLLVGGYMNYYLLNELSLGITLFF